MSGIISLKGNKYGLTVNISMNAPFGTIKEATAEYFKNASKMFGDEKIAIGFEGKPLSDAERAELIDVIKENCSLNILCVLDFNAGTEERFKSAIEKFDVPDIFNLKKQSGLPAFNPDAPVAEPLDFNFGDNTATVTSELIPEIEEPAVVDDFDLSKIAKFYKGNVRNGMTLNEESSLVIFGDVNPGGEVYSEGSIIILGSLKGKAFAGTKGNSDCYVFSLGMDPLQIQIADKIGRASDGNTKNSDEHEPKIALVKNNAIAIELYSKMVLNDIKL